MLMMDWSRWLSSNVFTSGVLWPLSASLSLSLHTLKYSQHYLEGKSPGFESNITIFTQYRKEGHLINGQSILAIKYKMQLWRNVLLSASSSLPQVWRGRDWISMKGTHISSYFNFYFRILGNVLDCAPAQSLILLLRLLLNKFVHKSHSKTSSREAGRGKRRPDIPRYFPLSRTILQARIEMSTCLSRHLSPVS